MKKTEHEMLVLAAKAIGMKIDPIDAEHDPKDWEAWNPLRDDGDAQRLAVALELDVGNGANPLGEKVIMVSHAEKFGGWFEEPRGADPYAATRRAIVRAAAHIGEAMP